MKRFFSILPVLVFSTALTAQCNVDTIPSGDAGGGICYINDVIVNSIGISVSSGFSSPPSYQNNVSSYIQLDQGTSANISIGGQNGAAYNVCGWVDFDQDGFYSSTEIIFFDQNVIGPISNTSFYVDFTVPADTFRMRIGKHQGFSGWGPGVNDACDAPGWGETEDYSLIVNCAPSSSMSFDPFPLTCWADSILLSGFPAYGDLAWYSNGGSTYIGSGTNIWLHTNPNCTDTTIYLQNTTPGCTSNAMETMQITLSPTPVAQILGPDTVQSCSAVTITASATGPYDYSWSTGSATQSTTISGGHGGVLELTVTDPSSGCYSTDQIWTNIAPNPPATYTSIVPGMNYCADLEINLQYDSLIALGTCSWYTFPSLNFIGAGSLVNYTPPGPGTYQFIAYVNSFCGLDTIIRTFTAADGAPYDSLYTAFGNPDSTGAYVLCYSSTGTIDFVISGLEGTVQNWTVRDTTINASMNLSGDTIISLPSIFMQQGHVYTLTAQLLSSNNCPDTSETVIIKPANTINFNLSDTTWTCSFPVWIGQSNVNYATYDILWSSGDTTTPISITGQSTYTLYTIDHATGCVMHDTTVVADQGLFANPLSDTTYACTGTGYFNLLAGGYNPGTWEEYDMSWNLQGSGTDPEYYSFDGGGNDYVVVNCTTSMGCPVTDTTFVDYSGIFSFSLGPDISTMITPVTLTGPAGNPTYIWTPQNVTTPSVQIYTSGTYYLFVENGQGCSYTDTIVVTILPTGVNEYAGGVTLNTFPNPANEHVTIAASESISLVRIFSTDGSLVKCHPVSGSVRTEINTRDLAEGYYILEVETAKGTAISKMIISR